MQRLIFREAFRNCARQGVERCLEKIGDSRFRGLTSEFFPGLPHDATVVWGFAQSATDGIDRIGLYLASAG